MKKEIQNLHNKLEKAYQDFGHVNKAAPIADKVTPPKRPEHPYLMNDDYVDPNNRNYVLPKTYPSYHPKHENYVMPNPKNSTARPSIDKPTLAERQKSQGEDYLTLTESDYVENQESSENIYGEILDNTYGEVE